MKKTIKWFAIFAAIGTAIGLVIAFLCKDNSEEETYDFDLDDDNDDLDLDSDLQPVERGYVSLNKTSAEVAPEDIADEEVEATADAKEEVSEEAKEEAVEAE